MKGTALYLRLSREDEERKSESQSIVNQRAFLLRYAAENGLEVYDTYIDDGFTGTNFDRPGFRRMIADIESGLIGTVLVKDLSRLGRDHIDTGYYYERYFPARNVRFIAVNDGIDTEREAAGNDMGLFKAAFNDLYAKDISKKVVTALQAKKKNGEFIGAVAPYGYRKSAESKNRLEPEPEESETVRHIFERRLMGEGYTAIARWLDGKGIPPPSVKRGSNTAHWSDTVVKRILTNPTYCGDLTQNRSRKINYKVDRRRVLPAGEWITVRNTHEPLVSRHVFERVQAGIQRRTPGPEHPLSGFLFCASCGSRMSFVSRGRYSYAVCGGWKRSGGKRCRSHCCREDELIRAVFCWLEEKLDRDGVVPVQAGISDAGILFQSVLERVEMDEEKRLTLYLRTDV